MKINPKVCLTKRQDVIPCTCLQTGIASALLLPQLPKGLKGESYVFEYIHPLSYWSNAQGMIKAGRKYLEQLEPQVLAGLILTTFQHFSLLDKYELNAVEANAVLCTASKDSLLDLACLGGLLTAKNSESAPVLVLEWKDLRYAQTIDSQLLEYIKRLRAEFVAPVGTEDTAQRRIQILNAATSGRTFKNGVQLLSAKASLAAHEKEFEATLRSAKREIKDLLALMRDQGTYATKLLDFLAMVCTARNLVAMDSDLRKSLQEKLLALKTVEASRIAQLLKDCDNPYDIFAKADDALERASDAFQKPSTPRSLKEILAAKKAGTAYCVARETQTSGGAGTSHPEVSSNDPDDEAFDADVEELLDHIPEEESEDLTEEDDGLEDTYSRLTKGIYASKDF